MTNEPKPSSAPSVFGGLIAGASVWFALPLLFSAAGEDGVSQLFLEGGFPTYLVAAAAMLVALIQCILIIVSGRTPMAALVAPVMPALPLAFGAFGFYNGMVGSLQAVAHVAPVDKITITYAAVSEAVCGVLIGSAFAGVLWLGQLIGLGLVASGQTDPKARWPLAAGAVSAGALALWTLADGYRTTFFRQAFVAAAHVAPADRLTLLGDNVLKVATLDTAGLAIAGIGLLAAAGALALAFARAGSRAILVGVTAGFALLCLLATVAISVRTMTNVEDMVNASSAADPELGAPLAFEGPAFGSWNEGVHLGRQGSPGQLEEAVKRVRRDFERSIQLYDAAGERKARDELVLVVRLHDGATPEALRGLIREADRDQLDGVRLVGVSPPNPALTLPRSLQALRPGLRVEVAYDIVFHGDTPHAATLSGDAVVLDGKSLPFAWSTSLAAPEGHAVLNLDGAPDVMTVLRAVATLHKAGFRAVVEP